VLSKGECLWLLKDLGIPVDSKEDRKKIVGMIPQAHTNACNAELSTEEVGVNTGDTCSFWLLLHLLRLICRENESKALTLEEAAMDESRFSRAEVAEFREVFTSWVRRSNSSEFDTDQQEGMAHTTDMCRRRSLPRFQNAQSVPTACDGEHMQRCSTASQGVGHKETQLEAMLGTLTDGYLPYKALQRLIISVSVPLCVKDTHTLKEKAVEISEREDGSVDFSDFLRILRWILDTNLADISHFSFAEKDEGNQKPRKAVQNRPSV
jgi:hypothetical protein